MEVLFRFTSLNLTAASFPPHLGDSQFGSTSQSTTITLARRRYAIQLWEAPSVYIVLVMSTLPLLLHFHALFCAEKAQG